MLDLDPAWARIRCDVPKMLIGPRVDNRQPTGLRIPEPHVKVLRDGIIANMVSIGADRQARYKREVLRAENLAGAVVPLATNSLLKSGE